QYTQVEHAGVGGRVDLDVPHAVAGQCRRLAGEYPGQVTQERLRVGVRGATALGLVAALEMGRAGQADLHRPGCVGTQEGRLVPGHAALAPRRFGAHAQSEFDDVLRSLARVDPPLQWRPGAWLEAVERVGQAGHVDPPAELAVGVDADTRSLL